MSDSRVQMNQALGWLGSATLLMRVLDVISTIAVLHYLTQEELGLASLSLGVMIIAEALSGLGVANAIVQAATVSKDEQSSLFWWCIGVATALAFSVWLGSRPIAAFYGDPMLAPMVAASGIKLMAVGAAVVPLQLLVRAMKFKQVGLVQTGASFAEAATKIGLAAVGFGGWSLVLASVMRGLALFVALSFVTRFVPRFHFRRGDIAPFVSFGVRASLATLVSETSRNIDYFLIGKYLGVSTLGIYRVAFDVAMTPAEAIAQPIYRVTLPVFARLSLDPAELRAAFLRACRYLWMLTAPIAVFLTFGAIPLLSMINAGVWRDAAPALGILSWAGVLRVSTRLFSTLFVSRGRPDLALLESVLTLAVLAIGMTTLLALYGDTLGVLAVCYAWLLAYPLLFVVFWRLSRQVITLELRSYVATLLPIATSILITWVVMALVAHSLESLVQAAHPLVRVIVLALGTAGTFSACMGVVSRARRGSWSRRGSRWSIAPW